MPPRSSGSRLAVDRGTAVRTRVAIVRPVIAIDGVEPGAAVQPVVPCASADRVVAAPACDDVVASPTGELIRAFPVGAKDVIVTSTGVDYDSASQLTHVDDRRITGVNGIDGIGVAISGQRVGVTRAADVFYFAVDVVLFTRASVVCDVVETDAHCVHHARVTNRVGAGASAEEIPVDCIGVFVEHVVRWSAVHGVVTLPGMDNAVQRGPVGKGVVPVSESNYLVGESNARIRVGRAEHVVVITSCAAGPGSDCIR